jgi:hypothetical protein
MLSIHDCLLLEIRLSAWDSHMSCHVHCKKALSAPEQRQMRRLFEVRGLPARVILVALFTAPPLLAGLQFQPVASPSGADVSSLASDATTLWAGTYRGVWRMSAGAWTFDGFSDKTIVSMAVTSDGTVWAAASDGVYRRLADGTWTAETLPSPPSNVGFLLADGSTLYAGGLAVYRRVGGTWTMLPSAGRSATAAAIYLGDLVVGLQGGGSVRYSGASIVPMPGMGNGESANALAVGGGTLWAGTERGLYSWNGVTWVADTSFGVHDVRALTGFGGTVRAGTPDGVFRKSGPMWLGENDGLLFRSVRAFGVLGSDLYAGLGIGGAPGIAGGPVYKLYVARWIEAAPGLNASIVSDILATSTSYRVATRGSGLSMLSGTPALPDGCGDVRALTPFPGDPSSVLAATSCGPLGGGVFSWISYAAGLPGGIFPTALTTTQQAAFGGTPNAGVYSFGGSSWSAFNSGLSSSVGVPVIRQVGMRLLAGTDAGLYLVQPTGSWSRLSDGLPPFSQVLSLGGGTVPYAGLTDGAYRLDGTTWRSDSTGLGPPSGVLSIELAGRRLFAAGGTDGVFRKKDGGWLVESAGLPAGIDARVVRAWPSGAGPGVGLIVGTAGHGLFSAPAVPLLKTVPVVLDVVSGATGARFRTELTLGNRGAQDALVDLTFVAAPGFGATGGGTIPVEVSIPVGGELRISDAIGFLRGVGLPLPPSGPVAGSLSIKTATTGFAASANDDFYAVARTYTRDSSGSYGVAYDAPSDLDAAEDEAAVYGLRSIAGVSRSNLAVVHVPDRSFDPITLSVQIYAANGQPSGAPLTKTLAPGEWYQWSGVLGTAGLPDGAFGYARITRASGSGPWIAYGVVNDQLTNDGSFLPAYRPGGLAAARRLLVPVVLDVPGEAGSHFTTELTLANDSPFSTPVDLVFHPAPGFGTITGAPVVTLTLAARAQTTIDDIVQYLRDHGVRTDGPQVGTLSVEFRALTSFDLAGAKTVALARTSTPNPNTAAGGSFGVFYEAPAKGGGARTSAVVPALTQDTTVRSNLAVVHLGGGSELPLALSVQLYDATTGVPVGHPLGVTLQPGDWFQWTRVIEAAGALGATSKAVAVITRVSGDDTFYAYGVLNDATTSDGTFLKMLPSAEY